MRIKPAKPPKLPVKINISFFANELADASFELGKLDGLQRDLPNPSLLISPLTAKEATVSSKIEGTRSTISDVFMFEATSEGKYDDTVEVVNYRKAMIWAQKALRQRRLNLSFIKELHNILLKGARGERYRGEFRKEQVFIGEKGATIEKATYIPPEPILIQEYMENLDDYILNSKDNPLIKSAIIHYQFEAIHPFQDGNGRIGRLLIPLYLYQQNLLYQPTLFLSGYFEKNRGQYINVLHLVDTQQNYERWIKFFLISVERQSEETQRIINKIKFLNNEVKEITREIRSPYISQAVDFIFKKPVFSISDLSRTIQSNRVTASRLVKRLLGQKVVSSFVPPKKKRRFFVFTQLIKLLNY